MAKKESTFLNMVLTLFAITFIASSALGFVYEITKGPIEISKQKRKNAAIREVVPEFDNVPTNEAYYLKLGNDSLVCYVARVGYKWVGTAIETYTKKGFGGEVKLMVGLLPDGIINDVVVLEHKETPGLGDKMEKNKSSFSLQFKGKNPKKFRLSVKKDNGDVDAITASTISSRAYCDAVKRAVDAFNNCDAYSGATESGE